MSFATNYLSKVYNQHLNNPVSKELCGTVVIPCYSEPDVFKTLQSLLGCTQTKGVIEVIIVVNYPEYCSESEKHYNIKTYNQLLEFSYIYSNSKLIFYPFLLGEVRKKFAGPGFARKIGMDEAIYRFNFIEKPQNFIISLDADTTVSQNYLIEIENAFLSDNSIRQTVIPFLHQTENLTEGHRKAITLYELYLRYYRMVLEFIGWQWAYYTIGSAFAVRASVYVEQTGMNRRNAGEDFYFLNKLFPLGGTSVLKNCIVYPSARVSNRVVFGTGTAVEQIIANGLIYNVYSLESFFDLQYFINGIQNLFKKDIPYLQSFIDNAPLALAGFWRESGFLSQIIECNNKSSNINSFTKHIYRKFDAFQVVKFLNFAHIRHYRKNSVTVEFHKLLKKLDLAINFNSEEELLEFVQKIENTV